MHRMVEFQGSTGRPCPRIGKPLIIRILASVGAASSACGWNSLLPLQPFLVPCSLTPTPYVIITIEARRPMRGATTITWEEFLAAGEDGQRWEWVDGEVEFMSPVNLRHENFLVLLITCLGQFCRANPEWMAFASNGVFTMQSTNWRMP